MPRIRTLKPEHRQHRKVGQLDHITYRLWVGMILEADDEGRLVYDPEALRVLIFGYHVKVTRSLVEASTNRLDDLGLVCRYAVEGQEYVSFPSWHDHQKIDRKRPSLLPPYEASSSIRRALDEHSSLIGSDLSGSDRKGSDLSISSSLADVSSWSTAEWPSPEALADMYNRLTPDNVPPVKSLSVKRQDQAKKLLRQFPDRAWWEETFARYHRSQFLSGRTTPSPGHAGFRPDFDWLLANGKTGTENCVKVHDGNYR